MKFNQKQVAAGKLFVEALNGSPAAQIRFIEGISTSDLPVQLTPTLTRIAQNEYEEIDKRWTAWAGRETLSSFQSSPVYTFQWGDEDVEPSTAGTSFISGGLARVPEYGEYPVLRFTASEKSLTLAKNGVQIKFSWETLIETRDFGLIQKAFREFGRRAAFQEDIEATLPLVHADGLNDTNFNVGNQNVLAGNPILSLESVQAALTAISAQTVNGRRVVTPNSFNLVVPESLEAVAKAIQAVQTIETVTTVGDTETRVITGNPVAGKFDVVVNNKQTLVDGSANADTTWFLLPKVGQGAQPSVVNVFLQGHEAPEVFVQQTTTGSPENGAFIDDSYSTKTRHVVSGAFISPVGTMASNGSGV